MAKLPISGNPLEMFQEVGLGLSSWEGCEFHLAEIFQTLCESRNKAPFRCYGAIISTKTRIELLYIALDSFFPQEGKMKAKIKKIIKEAERLSTLRNDLTHATVYPTFDGKTLTFKHVPLSHQTKKYNEKGPKRSFTYAEIHSAANEINKFTRTLKTLSHELAAFSRKYRQQRRKQSGPETLRQAQELNSQAPAPQPELSQG
jgi:hypothetical protein